MPCSQGRYAPRPDSDGRKKPLLDHLAGPLTGMGVTILKEILKTQSAGNLAGQSLETSKRLFRLEFTSLIHSLLLGKLLETFKDNPEKILGAMGSVGAVYGLFTTSWKDSFTKELQNVKGAKQDQIDKAVQEFMDLVKLEADRMMNIIKASTNAS